MADGGNINVSAPGVNALPEKWQNLDFGTLMMMLAIEQSQTTRQAIEAQVADMYSRNDEIKKLNGALNELRSIAPEKDEKGKKFTASLSAETQATLNKHGISDYIKTNDDGSMELKKDGDYQRMIDSIKTEIESMSSNNQLDMLKLQSLNNDYTQIIDRASNIESSDKQTKSNITSNLR